ncbi:MAG: HlyD family efflux transporter periplasmic adaptor subunit, partial [Eubacteriales bacterium]
IAALALLVVGYLVFSLVSNVYTPTVTTVAIAYEAGEGCAVMGYVVREETVLTSTSPIVVAQFDEGKRVGNNQVVAYGYDTDAARQTQGEIDAIVDQLEQLEFVGNTTVSATAIPVLDKEILDGIFHVNMAVAQGDYTTAYEKSPSLEGLVLRRTAEESDMEALATYRTQLESQLSVLQSTNTAGGRAVIAPHSGYYSNEVDGFESILTVESLSSMTVAGFENMVPTAISDNAFGRLIGGDSWYFVFAIPEEYLQTSQVGDWVGLSFSGHLQDLADVKITYIGEVENGECLVTFQSKDNMADMTMLRYQQAYITFQSYSGLRVPKEALQVDANGNPGVYVLESAKAQWKNIQILYDNSDSYVVALDKSSTSNLWPGDEIILQANDLYNGKVVG